VKQTAELWRNNRSHRLPRTREELAGARLTTLGP
jgi:hypothetical protein